MVRTKFWKLPARLGHKAQNRRDGFDKAAAEIVPISQSSLSGPKIPQSSSRWCELFWIIVEVCRVNGR